MDRQNSTLQKSETKDNEVVTSYNGEAVPNLKNSQKKQPKETTKKDQIDD